MFLPVIHVENKEQVINQIQIALINGADGVFLINHYIEDEELIQIYKTIRILFPKIWIGLNLLGSEPLRAFELLPNSVNGLWTDNAYINETSYINNKQLSDYQIYAERVIEKIKEKNWKGLYFGGVAFKYQKKVRDLIKTTEIACRYMDIITTSGIGIGIPPKVKKIKVMSKIVHKNNKKLAIASGITPENIIRYKSADIFMVATGISYDFTHFNPQLIRELKEGSDQT